MPARGSDGSEAIRFRRGWWPRYACVKFAILAERIDMSGQACLQLCIEHIANSDLRQIGGDRADDAGGARCMQIRQQPDGIRNFSI